MTTSATQRARIAVLGLGLIGRRHAGHAAREGQLVAAADPNPATAGIAEQQQVPHYASLDNLLDAEIVDGVVIATPNQLHEEHALACIARGIPVLIEKPIAHDVAAAERIAAASEQSGVHVLVGHHRRHNPIIARAKKTIEDGALGRLVTAHTTCWLHKPPEYFDTAWRREKGAGPVYINLIHDIDLLLHFCGPVAEVQAMQSNALRCNAVEDTATVLLGFDSGVLATVTVSDTVSAPWSWELTAGENPAYPHTHTTSTLLGGTEASLSVPDLTLWRHDTRPDWWQPMTSTQLTAETADPLVLQMQHFADVALGHTTPTVTAQDGLAALRVIEAIKQAAADRSCISLRQ